ncbi:hypothetical protein PGQ11_004624 [Apiospora arundinis]|uniref:Uncharacterized protein n=1 Tax=Apiospora arundinis TaxID=335852 RepID=A0ABR2J8U7_9PEZI
MEMHAMKPSRLATAGLAWRGFDHSPSEEQGLSFHTV